MSWIVDQDQLHITIGSTPRVGEAASSGRIDLDSELQMIKAALLYADHSTLCSPTASVFAEFVDMAELSTSQRLAFFETIPSWCQGNPAVDEARDLTARYKRAWSRRYSRKGEELVRKFERGINETWPAFSKGFREVVTNLGGDEILEAAESGLLNIHRFEAPIGRSVLDSEKGSIVDQYVSVVGATISDKSTYPLFDEQTNSIISSGIRAGLIPVSQTGIARGQEVGLAADLFSRLPLFPHASVKEILDIRRELAKALLGFRSAMLKFSKEIKNASWDDDFSRAAETVFRQEVAPAILEIEAAVESNRFMIELAQRIVPASGVALSALALSMSNLPHAALAALSIGVTATSAAVIQAFRGWADKRQATEQNHLYFYYKAGQFLEDGSYEYVKDKV
jgi:hypothetical protein